MFIFVQTSLYLFCDRAFTGHTHSFFSIRRNPSPNTVGPVLKGHTKRISTFGFQARISLNAGQKYCRMLQGELSAILLTYIKLSFVLKTFVMSICEWPLKTVFVYTNMCFLLYPWFKQNCLVSFKDQFPFVCCGFFYF